MAKTTRLVGQLTDRGRVRETNEDRVYVFQPEDPDQGERWGSFYAVADGMGGHEAGAVAADRAIRKVVEEYYYGNPGLDVRESLTRAVQAANNAVRELSQPDSKWTRSGTTFVGAVVRGNHVVVANVGDSRAYLIRHGTARCLTRDHSWVAEQVTAGKMTLAQARVDHRRNLITRSLGTQPDVAVDLFEESLVPDDVLVLCSDGLHGLVGDQEIEAVATRCSPQEASEELVRRANDRGGTDNISVVVVGPPRRARAVMANAPPRISLAIMAILGVIVLVGALAAALSIQASPTAGIVDAVVTSPGRPVVAPPPAIQAPVATPVPVREVVDRSVIILTAQPDVEISTGRAIQVGGMIVPTATLVASTKDQTASSTPTADRSSPVLSSHPLVATKTPEQLSATPTLPPTRTPQRVLALNAVTYPPGEVVLSWSLSGGLAPDETFDVRAWRSDEPAQTSVANSSETSYAIGGSFPPGDYFWSIAVIRIPDKSTVLDSSQTSSFAWSPTGVGDSGGSSGIGQRHR